MTEKSIFILFAAVGERHEDSTPIAFISLDHLCEFVRTFSRELIEDEESMGPYYLSVLVPNKPVADEGDLEVYIEKHECIAVEGQGRFCASNKSDWCRLVDLIKEIHRKIVMK